MHVQPLKDIESLLEETIDPLVADAGLRLVSVDVERRGKRLVVTVCLDREGGIDVDTCAGMSEEISRHLDVEDVISESYNLEVESPGLQRVLRKPREFHAFVGREVEIVLRQAFEGRQKIRGRLKGADEEGITVFVDGEEMSFPYQALKKTKLYFDAPW
jgi:ribosome maturation factor RimP